MIILLFKQRKVDKELWNIDDALQAEVILTSKQRIQTFGLKGNFENFVTKRQRVGHLQTFTVKTETDAVRFMFLLTDDIKIIMSSLNREKLNLRTQQKTELMLKYENTTQTGDKLTLS